MDSKGRGRGEGRIERHSSRPNEQRPRSSRDEQRGRIEDVLMREQRRAEAQRRHEENEREKAERKAEGQRRHEEYLERRAATRARLNEVILQKEEQQRRWWSTISEIERRMSEASYKNQTRKFIELQRKKMEIVLKVNQATSAIDDIRRKINNLF